MQPSTLEELDQWVEKNFQPYTFVTQQKAFTYNRYIFETPMIEGRDVAPVLVDRLKSELELLKTMGAVTIAWSVKPQLEEKYSGDGMFRRIAAHLAALTKDGDVLRTGYEYVEATLPELVPAKPKPEPVAIAGYDLVEDKDDAILLCARIIHSTVEAMNKAHNEYMLSWEQSRDSVIAGVKRHLENPKETPAENHAAWVAYRTKEGWVYGTSKDSEKKTHPCMVPYEALGPFQQSKDAVFMAIVDTFFGL